MADDNNKRIILLIVLIVLFVSFAFGVVKEEPEPPELIIIP